MKKRLPFKQVLKRSLLNEAYMWLWITIGWGVGSSLTTIGLRGKYVMSTCIFLAMALGIVASKVRRQTACEIFRAARDGASKLVPRRRRLVVRPPVSCLDRIAQLLWSAKTYERVFKPARADIVHEWQQSEIAGDVWRTRVIRYVRGPYSMVAHMVAQVPFSIGKLVVKLWTGALG